MYLNDFTISGNRGRKRIYPVDEWFSSGKVVRLTRGVDFKMEMNTFQTYLYGVAKKKGYKVTSRSSGNVIEFRATKIEEVL